jgi:hypothetical protein
MTTSYEMRTLACQEGGCTDTPSLRDARLLGNASMVHP